MLAYSGRKAFSLKKASILEQILFVPNILSLSRLVLLPFVWVAVDSKTITSYLVATFLIFIILISDAFDGYLATKLDQKSELGLFLDPICDKITGLVLMGLFTIYDEFPLWVLIVIAARDLLILMANSIFVIRKKAVFRSDFFGRWAFIFLSITLVLYSLGWFGFVFTEIKRLLLGIVLLFMLISSIQYMKNFINEWKKYYKSETYLR